MQKYDYVCPECKEKDITFKEISKDKVFFFCNTCRQNFSVADQEGGYLRQKVISLCQRYPAQ